MIASWTLRPLIATDYACCVALWAATEGIGDAPDLTHFTSFLARNAGFSQVALVEDHAVGVILASYDGIRGYFYRLAVDREWRRHGLASALVEAATAALREAGAVRINLQIFGDNLQAHTFWQRRGWIPYENLETWRRELADS